MKSNQPNFTLVEVYKEFLPVRTFEKREIPVATAAVKTAIDNKGAATDMIKPTVDVILKWLVAKVSKS